jgi:phage terminase small subunit
MALTLKQQRYTTAYLGPAKGNATEAARIAGYRDPEQSGWENRHNLEIAARIEERLLAESLSSGEVLAELTAIARAGWTNFVRERTDYKGEVISATLDLGDKVKALELLGKYHKLFTDKTEHSVDANFLDALRAFATGADESGSAGSPEASDSA